MYTKSKVIYSKFPTFKSQLNKSLIVADSYFKKNSVLKEWMSKGQTVYWVEAGEELKTLNSFQRHFPLIVTLIEQNELTSVTGWGGGSVGDFVGFFASVYRRGFPLMHVPTTYLAAVDSAHGGKTALNFKKAKNQIGTFYSAEKIFICEALLRSQGVTHLFEGWFELFKIILIGSPREALRMCEGQPSEKLFFTYLKKGIELKYKIVSKDPYEKLGLRRVLNLGHTLGHVFESEGKIPHGWAVGLGLRFSVEWSYKNGLMDWIDFSLLFNTLSKWLENPLSNHPLRKFQYPSTAKVRKGLSKDKKKSSDAKQIYFIALQGFGGATAIPMDPEVLVKFYEESLSSASRAKASL